MSEGFVLTSMLSVPCLVSTVIMYIVFMVWCGVGLEFEDYFIIAEGPASDVDVDLPIFEWNFVCVEYLSVHTAVEDPCVVSTYEALFEAV